MGLIAPPRKRYIKVLKPRTCECDQIWKWGIWFNQVRMSGPVWWAMTQYVWCPYKKRKSGYIHREEKVLSLTLKNSVMKEAETGMLELQAWEPTGLTAATSHWEEAKTESYPDFQASVAVLTPQFQRFSHFCCVEPLSLGRSVKATLGNWCSEWNCLCPWHNRVSSHPIRGERGLPPVLAGTLAVVQFGGMSGGPKQYPSVLPWAESQHLEWHHEEDGHASQKWAGRDTLARQSIKSESEKQKSSGRVRLFATPWTVACQAPLCIGILQARILEWVAIPFSRESSQPRDLILVETKWNTVLKAAAPTHFKCDVST